MWRWLTHFWRRRLLRRPFPTDWLAILEQSVPFYLKLSPSLQQRFCDLLKVFIWEKQFVGAKGFVITDEVRVVIGATAVRLVLGLDLSYYDRLYEIVVYPYVSFKAAEDEHWRIGEMSTKWGTVVFSWPAVLQGLSNAKDSHNVGFHEFAHVIDKADGVMDGTPKFIDESYIRPWAKVMERHFLRLRDQHKVETKLIDFYGATNEAEFFAVVTETFFENPAQLKKKLPDLYAVLSKFYKVDPDA